MNAWSLNAWYCAELIASRGGGAGTAGTAAYDDSTPPTTPPETPPTTPPATPVVPPSTAPSYLLGAASFLGLAVWPSIAALTVIICATDAFLRTVVSSFVFFSPARSVRCSELNPESSIVAT